jgi:PAS domain-containing protein
VLISVNLLSWLALSSLALLALMLGLRAPKTINSQKLRISDSEVFDRAKAVIWVEDDKNVIWSNAVHKTESEVIGQQLCAKNLKLNATDMTINSRAQRVIPNVISGGDRYYEIFCEPDGVTTVYTAICARSAITAEKDRDRFVQTISDSFAHLQVGITVFDKERDLSLFNPAIVEILGLSAMWLAQKPSLKDFLNRLHDKGAMPEPRDFNSWRDQIVDMEQNAQNDNYQDDWHTPNNQVLRVTGRSHPKGAVVFLFEDITQQTQTELAYRSELERQYQILDILDFGIAIFDAAGRLSIANKKFDEHLQSQLSNRAISPTIFEVSELWQTHFQPSPLWGDIRDFIAHTGARETFSGTVHNAKGLEFDVRTSPLLEGYSMVEISPENI